MLLTLFTFSVLEFDVIKLSINSVFIITSTSLTLKYHLHKEDKISKEDRRHRILIVKIKPTYLDKINILVGLCCVPWCSLRSRSSNNWVWSSGYPGGTRDWGKCYESLLTKVIWFKSKSTWKQGTNIISRLLRLW